MGLGIARAIARENRRKLHRAGRPSSSTAKTTFD
jgi:hypothetical protein